MPISTACTARFEFDYLNRILGLAFVEVIGAAGLLALTTRGGAGGGLPLPDR